MMIEAFILLLGGMSIGILGTYIAMLDRIETEAQAAYDVGFLMGGKQALRDAQKTFSGGLP